MDKMDMRKRKHTRKQYSLTIPGKVDISREVGKISTRAELPNLPDGYTWVCTNGRITGYDGEPVTQLNFLSGLWSKVMFG